MGGDTNEACDIIISGMAYGLAEEKRLVLRGTSKPGDILATTGGFGNTTAAFKILLEGARGSKDASGSGSSNPSTCPERESMPA